MYYPSSAGSVTSFVTPHYPVSRSYYPTAPMSAVMPGQHYYPTMHSAPMAYPMSAAPVMMGQPSYGYGMPSAMPYYGHTPTVILPSRSHRHRRSRSRGFLGYL
ncbi:hypothetical protein GALMADRAFT_253918 [Galerina marginata CBS 339.88]|uniref:Uncharacterized protein n=1 Tax=Galerina marginata (strain CBS 339.88) TaxID=685588 RepID=A0A067SV63_GALM3|nr:hypothetical protein GALMADRAFT_253918 [Galerina marginata CBS 339.88]